LDLKFECQDVDHPKSKIPSSINQRRKSNYILELCFKASHHFYFLRRKICFLTYLHNDPGPSFPVFNLSPSEWLCTFCAHNLANQTNKPSVVQLERQSQGLCRPCHPLSIGQCITTQSLTSNRKNSKKNIHSNRNNLEEWVCLLPRILAGLESSVYLSSGKIIDMCLVYRTQSEQERARFT
jgi:hypothetical protein